MSSTIAVFGGTGYAGSNIAREAASRGHQVTATARTLATETIDGIEYRQGSLHDEVFVTEVAQNSDVIVVALPAREIDGKKLGDAIPALITAARAGNTRIGIVGGAGSLQVQADGPRLVDGDDFPEEYKPESLAHSAVLDQFRSSADGVDWFYLSPAAHFGSFNPGEKTGRYRTGGDVLLTDDSGVSDISGADYAVAFVDEIDAPQHSGKRFSVAY